MVVPLGCLYTPLDGEAPELPYEPLRCVCGGILNPHCSVDFRSKTWGCVFCTTRNSFPQHYANMNEQQLPLELFRQHDTVEYKLLTTRPFPTFVFVVDTCVDTDAEHEGLKEYILLALSKLPEQCNVALITYGATVQMHELCGQTEYPRSAVVRGSAEVTTDRMKTLLRNPSRFVCTFAEAEFTLTSIIEDLPRDLWPSPKDHRPLRCTGAALSAAASLLELVSPACGAGILAFVSGVCTEGPGVVVETSREKMIRGHGDIRDNTATARFWESSCAFYDTLMRRTVRQGHTLSVFSACLDQTGIAELKLCIQAAGGMFLSADSWKKQPFRTSLNRFFKRNDKTNSLEMGLNATFDVITSPTWKVMGVIGPCVGTGRKSNSVAESEIGMGGTCQWTTCMLDTTSTFAVYFETTAAPPDVAVKREPYRYTQFITKFEAGNHVRLRVTTARHHAQEKTSFPELANSFDQEAAAVLLARMAIHKTDTTPLFDVLRWLDRTVVRLVARFGEFVKDQPSSLKLPPRFVLFPAFMYHLRRSAYLQVFNSSPDETAILRLLFLRAMCSDSVLMIQPTLHSYTMQGPAQPVLLDSTAIQPENILLLDTFFEIVIHHGEVIAAWRKLGYDKQPEYAHFKDFLEVPRGDAAALLEHRYPCPRLIEVGKGEPDARILYNRINPSRTHNSENQYGGNPGELVYTDDAPLHVFMEHLKKLAVSQ